MKNYMYVGCSIFKKIVFFSGSLCFSECVYSGRNQHRSLHSYHVALEAKAEQTTSSALDSWGLGSCYGDIISDCCGFKALSAFVTV